MAKYGEFAYGTGTLYGTGEPTPQPVHAGRYLWTIEIQWDGATWINEAERASGLYVDRGRAYYLTRNGDGLEPAEPGRATITLANRDGRYDPYNPSSPLHGHIDSGARVRIAVRDVADGLTRYGVFTGNVSNITPEASTGNVVLECVDTLESLSRVDVSLPIQFDETIGSAADSVLRQAGIINADIQAAGQPVTLLTVDTANALDVSNRLAEATMGVLFSDVEGRIHLWGTAYNAAPERSLEQADLLKTVIISQPWDERRNDISVYANRWVVTTARTIWASSSSISVPGGGAVEFDVEFSNPSVALQPVSKTDYQPGIGGIIGGVAIPALRASLINISATGATVRITNSAPIAWSTSMRIRGAEYRTSYTVRRRRYLPGVSNAATDEVSTKIKTNATDAGVDVSKRAAMVVDNEFLQDRNYAQAYADALLAHVKNGTMLPRVTLETAAVPARQFGIELYDRVHLEVPARWIDHTYRLGRVTHEWLTDNGQSVRTEYSLIDPLIYTASITAEPSTPIVIIDPDDQGGGGTLPIGPGQPGQPGLPWNPPPSACLSTSPQNGPYLVELPKHVLFNYDPDNRVIAYSQFQGRGRMSHEYPTTISMTVTSERTTDDGQTWNPGTYENLNVAIINTDGVQVASTEFKMWAGTSEFSWTPIVDGVTNVSAILVWVTPGQSWSADTKLWTTAEVWAFNGSGGAVEVAAGAGIIQKDKYYIVRTTTRPYYRYGSGGDVIYTVDTYQIAPPPNEWKQSEGVVVADTGAIAPYMERVIYTYTDHLFVRSIAPFGEGVDGGWVGPTSPYYWPNNWIKVELWGAKLVLDTRVTLSDIIIRNVCGVG